MNFKGELSINFGELELRNSGSELIENLDCDSVQIEKYTIAKKMEPEKQVL